MSGCCLVLQVNLSNASRTQGGNSFDDSTLPLIDRNQKTDKKSSREEIQMSNMGPDNYSTLNEMDHSRTLDRSGDLGDTEPVKAAPLMQEEGQESQPEAEEDSAVFSPASQKI